MSALGGSLAGRSVLDLFSGSGALALEAASRGADPVVAVERARSSVAIIRTNVATLGATDIVRVVEDDAFRFLDRHGGPAFDVALADPPYGTGLARRLVERFLDDPFALELWVEHPSREALPDAERRRERRYGDTTLTTYLGDP